MTRIGRTDVLRPLAQLLRLSGTKTAPAEVDIERPLMPVMDVSRYAEQLGILEVYYPFTLTTDGIGGAGYSVVTEADLRADAALSSALTNLGLIAGASDWWLLSIDFATTTAGTFGGVQASIGPPATAGSVYNVIPGASTFDTFLGQANSVGASPRNTTYDFVRWLAGTTQYPAGQDASRWNVLPARLSSLNIRGNDQGAGAATIAIVPRYAFTPRGVRPIA